MRSSHSALPTTAPSQPSSRSVWRSSSVAIAARCDDRKAGAEQLLEQRHIWPGEGSVAPRARDHESRDAGRGAAARERNGRRVLPPRPAVDRHAAVARVDRDGDAIAEALDDRGQERLVERRSADEHACGACGQRGLDELDRAIPAAHLHREAGRGDPLDECEVRLPGEGAVEIDEMEPGRARGCEALGSADGVAAFHRHLLAAPFEEADDPSLEDVDRGVDGEMRFG